MPLQGDNFTSSKPGIPSSVMMPVSQARLLGIWSLPVDSDLKMWGIMALLVNFWRESGKTWRNNRKSMNNYTKIEKRQKSREKTQKSQKNAKKRKKMKTRKIKYFLLEWTHTSACRNQKKCVSLINAHIFVFSQTQFQLKLRFANFSLTFFIPFFITFDFFHILEFSHSWLFFAF